MRGWSFAAQGAQRPRLREEAEALGLVFVDLTPALQAGARRLQADKLLSCQRALHAAGHRLVGDALAAAIENLRDQPHASDDG